MVSLEIAVDISVSELARLISDGIKSTSAVSQYHREFSVISGVSVPMQAFMTSCVMVGEPSGSYPR
jgi:hypothetical protein